MKDQVIHVTDEAHDAAIDYCGSHDLRAKDWVSKLILHAVQSVGVKQQQSVAVAQEREVEVWRKPPFWSDCG